MALAQCSVCGRPYKKIKNGTIYRHIALFPAQGSCNGSGKPPCTCTLNEKMLPSWDDPECPAHHLPEDEKPSAKPYHLGGRAV